jgi:hypothetical protein
MYPSSITLSKHLSSIRFSKKDPSLSSLSKKKKGLSSTLYIGRPSSIHFSKKDPPLNPPSSIILLYKHLSLIHFFKKDPSSNSLSNKKKGLSSIVYCIGYYLSSIRFS